MRKVNFKTIKQFAIESKPAYMILTVSVSVTAIVLLILLINYIKMKTAKNPIIGRVTSAFGERIHPVTGIITNHNGVDVAASVGTPIKAPLSGTVIQINKTTAGGNQLILKHTNSYKTGYAHLSNYVSGLKEGDNVQQGDVVAYTGNTGQTTGAHLHFTLTNPMGVKVDPLLYFTFKDV